jgi:hypothetical protein
MRFDEFCVFVETNHQNRGIESLAAIIDDFTMKSKPLFWLRLVAFGHICREYIGKAGSPLGFEYRHYNLQGLLEKSEDKYILENMKTFKETIEAAVLQHL